MKVIRFSTLLLAFRLASANAEATSSSASSLSSTVTTSRTLLDGVVAFHQIPLLIATHARSLQSSGNGTMGSGGSSSSTKCVDSATAAQSCLASAVPDSDKQSCMSCFQSAQQTVLDNLKSDIQSGVNITCNSLDTVVCQPIETCSCVSACANELQALFTCQLSVSFDAYNVTGYDNCQISCSGSGSGSGSGGSGSGSGGSGSGSGGSGSGSSSSSKGTSGGSATVAFSRTTSALVAVVAAGVGLANMIY